MSDISKKFEVGDKVVRTVECEADYTLEQWGVYTISKVDEDLCVIFLEGIYDEEGKPDWFNPRNFELVKEDFYLGDRVKAVSLQAEDNRGDCEVGIGATGVITDIDEGHVLKYYVDSDEGDSWWWEEANLELVKEEETMSEQTATEQTPYQEKGYTENSLFKFVGDDGEFEQGEILKLYFDDGTCTLRYISTTTSDVSYLCFNDVEYVGEEGDDDALPDYEETVVKGIPSDGGASDYYFTKLPQHIINSIVITGGIEIKDIARYVYDNDADAFNIIKAEKRIIEVRKGKGKLGNTALYDANKIKFFANEQYEAIKHTEENHG